MELTYLGNKDKIASKYTIKTIFLGDHGVGKTSLINMFVEKCFPQNLTATIGVAFSSENIILQKHNNQNIRLQIWDTAGSEKFRSIARSYMRDVYVAFMVFDMTDRYSWANLNDWKKDLDDYKTNQGDSIPIIVLIASKSDLKNKYVVSENEIKNRAEEWNCKYYIISCKEDKSVDNITKMFHETMNNFHQLMVDDLRLGRIVPSIILEQNKNNNKYVDFYKSENERFSLNNCCSFQ